MDSASSTLNPKISAWSSRFVKRLLVQIGTFASLAIVCLALWVVYRTLQTIRLVDVVESFRALPTSSVLLAFCFTAASYVVMTGFEVVALRHINRPLPYP
ncbi:MAG TPA: hypothetical protein VHH93_04795, partial [Gammaproteobacteria bacterium]|nr:hypothetical protein [Gammaproteobacteria bacterium]